MNYDLFGTLPQILITLDKNIPLQHVQTIAVQAASGGAIPSPQNLKSAHQIYSAIYNLKHQVCLVKRKIGCLQFQSPDATCKVPSTTWPK